ncbi:hypothetical protein ACWU4D_08540 [Vibrio sp. WJH972]
MNRKIALPYITDTVLVEGVYHAERRFRTERRTKKSSRVLYERRSKADPRLKNVRSISHYV